MQIVAVVLLHNEDLFAERVVRNITELCDRIHIADHMSDDATWEIVSSLAQELDNVDAVRIAHAARSQDLVAPYIGTDTWVLSADGDELFDPDGLRRLRPELEAGRYQEFFRIKPATLHCVALDEVARTAAGHLAPPSLASTKLWNFAALDSWTGVSRERLHDGHATFKTGWEWGDLLEPGGELGFDTSPFRCLHTCFLRRSSRDPETPLPRLNIAEANSYRRDTIGRLASVARGVRRRPDDKRWKREKYRRGPVVTKDVTRFLAPR